MYERRKEEFPSILSLYIMFYTGFSFWKIVILEVDGPIIVTSKSSSAVNETWLEQKFSTVTKVTGFIMASLSYIIVNLA